MNEAVQIAISPATVTENIYLPKLAVLDRVSDDIPEVRTFYWHFEDAVEQAKFRRFRPGQFAQVSLFGIGEFSGVAAAQSDGGGDLFYDPRGWQLHGRPARAQAGRQVCGARTLWERVLDGRLLREEPGVRGRGIGLIPLRSCIVYALKHRDKYERIQIFYGSKTPSELMYLHNLREWQESAAWSAI